MGRNGGITGRALSSATTAATAAAAKTARLAIGPPGIGALFYGGVPRAVVELRVPLVVLATIVIARASLFMVPGVRFDADQAIVGLMAKHISEGRAFPVHFYGQSYLLAVEAYLAAPVMWLLGPTEVALKLPLLAMNVAAALLVARFAHRDLGLRPWLAAICALPVALPPIVVGTRLMEAMGGNAELPLYALLLWATRAQPWTFAGVAALTVVHRELAVYGLVALVLIEAVRGTLWTRGAGERWGLVVLAIVMARALVDALRPFGSMYGPGSIARPGPLDISSAGAVGAQLCADPSRWAERFALLTTEHLTLLVGGEPGPLNMLGVTTGVGQGNPGLGLWVLGLSSAALLLAMARPSDPVTGRNQPAGGPAPAIDFGWYLVAVGLLSILVYWLVACSQITLDSFRYDLLASLLPVGAVLVGVQRAAATTQAGLVTALALWVVLSAGDYLALAREIGSGRYPDYRGQAVAALEARGLTTLRGEFRLAHVLTFRSQERVIVSALERERIDEYAARARGSPFLTMGECPGRRPGEQLVPTIRLCPAP
jgi:hypothetical protein